ncbi:MAG: hypothetical protein PHN37_01990 [Candidatus Pacebacteria bacterium]|nr:hypothetical protein [Candidatus Paceibacterota bacterium]
MKKRNKIIFALSILFVFALFFIFNLSFAADWGGWEVTYPWNPPEPNLPQYIKYVYQISFWVGAFLAVIMIIIGGIEWSGAAANPQLKAAAKNKITRSIIGLLALFSIYIILNTVNPDLVRLKDIVIKEPTTSQSEENKIKQELMAGNFVYTANGIAIANSIKKGKTGSMGNTFDLPVNGSGEYAKLLTRALCSPPDADEFKNFNCTAGIPMEVCECQGGEGGVQNSCGNFCMASCKKYHGDSEKIYGLIAPKDRATGGLPSECTKLNHAHGGDPVACSCYEAYEDSFSSVQTFQLDLPSGDNPAICLCDNAGTTAAYFKGKYGIEKFPECRSETHDFCMDYCKRLKGYKFGYTSACEADYAYEAGYYTGHGPDHAQFTPRCTCVK